MSKQPTIQSVANEPDPTTKHTRSRRQADAAALRGAGLSHAGRVAPTFEGVLDEEVRARIESDPPAPRMRATHPSRSHPRRSHRRIRNSRARLRVRTLARVGAPVRACSRVPATARVHEIARETARGKRARETARGKRARFFAAPRARPSGLRPRDGSGPAQPAGRPGPCQRERRCGRNV